MYLYYLFVIFFTASMPTYLLITPLKQESSNVASVVVEVEREEPHIRKINESYKNKEERLSELWQIYKGQEYSARQMVAATGINQGGLGGGVITSH